MARKFVRIGSMENIHVYDDGDYASGVETDSTMVAGQAPTLADEVLRLGDIPSAAAELLHSDGNITDHAIVRGDGGARKVQGSLATISDVGSISIPVGQTVDGMDPSAHAANPAAHHAKYTDAEARASINNIFGSDGKADDDIDLDTKVLKKAGVQVVGAQQAIEADVAAVPDLTGADTIDQTNLESYLGDMRTTINSLLAKLRTHGLIDT